MVKVFPSLMSIVLLLLVISSALLGRHRPGTASYVFQVIAGAILGGVFLLRTYGPAS